MPDVPVIEQRWTEVGLQQQVAVRVAGCRIDPSDQPIIMLTLNADLPPAQHFDLANEVIKPRLEQISQVGLVQVLGGRKREIHVELDRVKLARANLSVTAIAGRLAATGQNISRNGFEQVMQMVRLLVQDLHVDSTQAVALESKQVLQSSFTFHWPLDLGAFMSSVTGSNEPTDRLDVLIEAQTHFSQYDAVALIEAPADAQIVPLTEIK